MRYDVVVMGAGSGGIGAALAAARAGCSVLLVEKADAIGGTVVHAGVHVWEMGVGGTGLPFDIYRRLKPVPQAVGIYSIGGISPGKTPGTGRIGSTASTSPAANSSSIRRGGTSTRSSGTRPGDPSRTRRSAAGHGTASCSSPRRIAPPWSR